MIGSMRRRSTVVAVTMAFSALATIAPPAAAASHTGDPVYVSLGDSLAVGFMPGSGPTHRGYVDQLWRRLREELPGLEQRTFGCPGETTRSIQTGVRSPCTYAAGSQLAAAVSFLERHDGQVPLVTISIGGNDVIAKCFNFRSGILDRACVTELLPRLTARVTSIVDALRAAAGPSVPIVGMTYYDPLLALWLVPGGRPLARRAARGWELFNTALTDGYGAGGAMVADVAGTFRIDDFDTVVVVHGTPLPINVALTCRWTWACSRGDIHPNGTGYGKIATAYFRVVRDTLA